MKLTKAELTEELESKKKILGYVRQRKRIPEEQYALEGLQARPNIRIEIEDTEENIAVREVEIDNLEKLLAEFDNTSGKGTSPLSPKELTYNLHERYIRLSIGQKRILALIERQPFDNSVVSQAELENNFSVTSAEGEPKGTARGILHKSPTFDEYSRMIAQVVTTKEDKSNEYDKDFNHVNLIIFDASPFLFNTTVGEFHGSFFTSQIKDALYKSRFREVFLITNLKERGYVYIPLKMVLLFSNFYMFTTMINEYFANEIVDSSEELEASSASFASYMLLFARYLKLKTENVLFRKEGERAEVILGNT